MLYNNDGNIHKSEAMNQMDMYTCRVSKRYKQNINVKV